MAYYGREINHNGDKEMVQPKLSQKLQVLNHLENATNGMTSWEAISEYGITRLAAYVGFLKDDGYRIEAVSETKDKKTFSRYFLVTEEK